MGIDQLEQRLNALDGKVDKLFDGMASIREELAENRAVRSAHDRLGEWVRTAVAALISGGLASWLATWKSK
jgi:hypothetical protein